MKMKKRYIVFRTRGAQLSEDEAKTGLHAFLLKFFGEYGYSKLGYKLMQYERDGFGLIRCERGSLEKMLGALALVDNLSGKKVRTISTASSGTIKTLREKGFEFIAKTG